MAKVPLNFKATKWVSALVVILAIGIVGWSSTAYTIQYGTIGVITRFGEIVGSPVEPGLHFKIPIIDNVLTYRTQKIIYETLSSTPYTGSSKADYQDYSVDTTTKDGQQVSIRYTVRFSIDPDEVKEIAKHLGTESEVVSKIVKTDSRIWSRNIPRNYSALDLYTGNIDAVSKEIAANLEPIFEDNGLILDEFGIRSISFDEAYVHTIEQKQIEKERVTTEEYIAQQEEFKKVANITKAEGEARSQQLQQETLTSELIRKLYIEKWNGILPEVMSGDSSSLLIDINN